MASSAITAGKWSTRVKVQCRYEPPFEATIRFHHIPEVGLVPYINCPHCGRGYFLEPNGKWVADRPLVILD